MEQIIRRFFWKGVELTSGGAEVAWTDITFPLDEGGLGIKWLDVWNVAAMGKHSWKLCQPTSTSFGLVGQESIFYVPAHFGTLAFHKIARGHGGSFWKWENFSNLISSTILDMDKTPGSSLIIGCHQAYSPLHGEPGNLWFRTPSFGSSCLHYPWWKMVLAYCQFPEST